MRLFRKKTQLLADDRPVTHEIPEVPAADFDAKPLGSDAPVQGPNRSGMPDELIFELGDFLHRIPPKFLQGEPDPRRELRFPIAQISAMISQGRTMIGLKEIVSRCPDIFREGIEGIETAELYFPWQKLARQVQHARPLRSAAPADQPPVFEAPFANRRLGKTGNANKAAYEPAPPAESKAAPAAAKPEAKPATPPVNTNARKMSWFNRGRSTDARTTSPIAGAPSPQPSRLVPTAQQPSADTSAKKNEIPDAGSSPASPPKASISAPAPGVESETLAHVREEHQKHRESFDRDRSAWMKERAEFEARLTEEKKAANAELERLRAEVATAATERGQLARELATATQEALQQKEEVKLALSRQSEELHHGFEKQLAAIGEVRDARIRECDAKNGELEQFRKERDEIAARLTSAGQAAHAEIENLKRQVESAAHEKGEMNARLEEAREASARQILAVKSEHEQLLAGRATELAAAIEARDLRAREADALRGELEQSRKECGEVAARLANAEKAVLAEIETLTGQVETAAQETLALKGEHERMLAERSEHLAERLNELHAITEARDTQSREAESLRAELDAAKKEIENFAAKFEADKTAFVADAEKAAHDREAALAELSRGAEARAAELEALRQERDRMALERDEAIAAARSQAEANELRLAGISNDRDETMDRVKALRRKLGKAQEEVEALAREKEAALAEAIDRLHRESSESSKQKDEQMEAIGRQIETLQNEQARLVNEKDGALAEAKKLADARETEMRDLMTERDRIAGESNALREEISKTNRAKTEEAESLRDQINQLREQHGAALREKEAEFSEAKRFAESHGVAFNTLTTERDRLAAELSGFRQETTESTRLKDEEVAAARIEVAAAQQARDAALAKLAAVQKAEDPGGSLRREIERLSKGSTAQVSVLQQQLETAQRELAAAREELARTTTDLAAERASTRLKLTEATATQGEQLVQLRGELSNAQKFRAEVTTQLSSVREESKRTLETQRQQLDEATRKVAQRDAEKRELQKRIDTLNAERERLAVEKAQALQRGEVRPRELESQLRALSAKHEETIQALRAAQQSLSESEARARELAEVRDELQRQLANIRPA